MAGLPPLVITLQSATMALPQAVDNSTNIYFPHDSLGNIRLHHQGNYGGSCVPSSVVFSVFTYEYNRLNNTEANSDERIYATHSIYNHINQGAPGQGTSPSSVFNLIQQTGVSSIADWGNDTAGDYRRWLHGYDLWQKRLQNRINSAFAVTIGQNGENLETIKHYLSDHGDSSTTGGILTTGSSYWNNFSYTLSSESESTGEYVIIDFTPVCGHQVTIVGYDDGVKFDVNHDNQFTNDLDITSDGIVDLRDWEIGAFKMADSYGVDAPFRNKGFKWILYRCLYNDQNIWGINPIVPDPEILLKVKLTHAKRNSLNLFSGWRELANSPYPSGPSQLAAYLKRNELVSIQGGELPLRGDYYPNPFLNYEPIEVILDYSYFFKDKDFGKILLATFTSYQTGNEKVIDFSMVDNRWGEEFELVCDEHNKQMPSYLNNSPNAFLSIEYDLIAQGPQAPPITTNTIFEANMVSRFTPTVANNATLTVNDGVRIDMYNSTITIDAGSSLELGNNVIIRAKRGDNKLIIKGNLHTGQNITFEAVDNATMDVVYDNANTPGVCNNINCNFIKARLLVKSGELSINNSELTFSSESKVIVMQQTKLTLGATHLTNNGTSQWPGIEVWGNTSQHQYTLNGVCAQGTVELKNHAVIENAANGITNWKPDDWNSIGGIIKAESATFKNCRRGVEFMKYRNFHPSNGSETDNLGYFRDCSFTVDDNYPANASPFYTGVSLWSVKGVKLYGCDFINNRTVKGSGYGIHSLDAGYHIYPICNSQTLPCPDENLVKTNINGFEYGINASNAETSNTINVQNAVFTDNGYGIELRNVNNAVVLQSNFQMASSANCPDYGVGINLLNCTGYAIEGNNFTSDNIPTNYSWTGIETINSGQAYNEIYKNTYQNLTTGNVADLLNATTNAIPPTGLTYLCNLNAGNKYDFFVTNNSNSRISYYQRSGSSTAAGNTFSPNASVNFFNEGASQVRYYYSTGMAPTTYSGIQLILTANANTCPSHYGGGTGNPVQLNQTQIDALEAQYADSYSAYNNVKYIYETLKDGGSTANTVEDIETSIPSEMWELRAKLLGDSPHLSQQVLMQAVLKTDVLPESVLFEILSANPDEMRDESFLSFLGSKENPLPSYMIDLLRAIAGNTSYKTVLQEQLNAYNTQKANAASDIIRSKLNDSIVSQTDIINWFDNRGDLNSRYQMVDAYLQTGNYAATQTMLTLIPGLHELSASDSADYQKICELKNLQINMLSAGRNLAMLTNAEKEQLSVIAATNTGIASTQAKGILEFMTGTPYCNCVRYNDVTKHSIVNPSTVVELPSEIKISVAPNPATTWITFEYALPEKLTSVTVTITDNTGRKIETLTLTGRQRQKVLDTRRYASGAYIYQCKQDKEVSGKFIIR
ncbi:MAG TPA: T9SS type A sorting domain-containing protein [Bacteroidales bacterium]|nr:T9SS type A sorting domain-containing protein [Bacteroidales bacterium]